MLLCQSLVIFKIRDIPYLEHKSLPCLEVSHDRSLQDKPSSLPVSSFMALLCQVAFLNHPVNNLVPHVLNHLSMTCNNKLNFFVTYITFQTTISIVNFGTTLHNYDKIVKFCPYWSEVVSP